MEERPKQLEALTAGWERVHSNVPKTLAANSGATLLPGGKALKLKMMDRVCEVDLSSRKIKYAGESRTEVSTYLQVLILHYLAGAGNAQMSNRLATFREFEGGAIYYPAFKARAIDMIVKVFGTSPDVLKHIGHVLRAEPVSTGDVGFRIHFFPKLPIVIVLWLGDDEVSPSANILFDANAGKMLPTEDLSVVGGAAIRWLVDISRK